MTKYLVSCPCSLDQNNIFSHKEKKKRSNIISKIVIYHYTKLIELVLNREQRKREENKGKWKPLLNRQELLEEMTIELIPSHLIVL